MKHLKFLLIILVVALTFSCKSDDEINLSDKLVGEWLRSDFSDDFEFKLIFQSDNSGLRTFREENMNGEVISSIVQFNWSLEGSNLVFDELDDIITTKYSINSEGQLLLIDYSDLYFIRVK